MVIIPDSAAVADDLSFTVGQITWTTGVNSFTVAATEEAQIRICVNHIFIGYSSDHTVYGSDHPSNGSDHADNSSTTPSLQRKDDRQHRPNRGYRPGRPQAFSNPDLSRFHSKSIYRAGTASPQQIYPTSLDSSSNMA
jgi:hypothetical protein